MHSYSLDTTIRARVHVALALASMSLPAFIEKVRTFLELPPQYALPITFGAVYTVLYLIFHKWVWRWCSRFLGIPDLNGAWKAFGRSSYRESESSPNLAFEMEVTIKQTFSHIEVFTQSTDSISRSTMASISTQHAVPFFRYAFENEPKSLADGELQRHPGMVSLRIEAPKMLNGDYFSGKHRLRHGELRMERV